jgi:3-methylcrotonyl-CoA carboxylase alpha subunit
MFKKILIANRGEIACRIQRACRTLGVATVAIHTAVDADAEHALTADERHLVGPEPNGYLDAVQVLNIARRAGCDAVHPGYGFLSESADFARAIESAGLAWIGPTPASISDMGDKERARTVASLAGVPVLPGSPRFDADLPADLDTIAQAIGFPLLVKASGGGGGIGMRKVEDLASLREAIRTTQALARKAFGDGTVYLEREVRHARHVEVQVFGFGDGRTVHLFERDCSIQRRYQKIVEEGPAPFLPEPTREAMHAAALQLASQQKYRGAGTVEFLYDIDRGSFYFLEMNTRIQVEHCVTEMITGVDLVRMQIELAAGDLFTHVVQGAMTCRGHAIECRVYAERPAKGFLPSTGTITRFDLPAASTHLRIETGLRKSSVVSHHYDPMIAKLITWDETRSAAAQRMGLALESLHIEGVQTNLSMLQRVVAHPAFLAGQTHTHFVDVHRADIVAA